MIHPNLVIQTYVCIELDVSARVSNIFSGINSTTSRQSCNSIRIEIPGVQKFTRVQLQLRRKAQYVTRPHVYIYNAPAEYNIHSPITPRCVSSYFQTNFTVCNIMFVQSSYGFQEAFRNFHSLSEFTSVLVTVTVLCLPRKWKMFLREIYIALM